jgi:hypothetical protein
MEHIKEKLQAPFPASEIEFRVQSCGVTKGQTPKPWVMVLAYVQARAIQKRLDDVFGWDGWSEEYRSQDSNMICRLGVRTESGWIYKENGASQTDIEAFKGGISGAFKRVASSGFGIGRYLYNLEESFAECSLEKPKNMSGWSKAKTKDKQLIYWKIPTLPSWALPSYTLDGVLSLWKEKGSTEEVFDDYISKQFKVTRETIQQTHLEALMKKLA